MPVKMARVDDKLFLKACEIASVAPTHRQWRKWMQGRGSARANVQAAANQLGGK